MTAGGRAPAVVAMLGPTASGKSALGLALARRFDGEIVACDSTAVYRGFDIGTDKVPAGEQGGIPHHCVDIVDPDAEYTAADYARDAMAAIRSIHARGRLPILVGGTGLYYRALVRGIFPGPGRDDRVRGRLDALAARRGPERLHRLLGRIDPPSARASRPRDRIRIVRALEVYFQSGRTLTDSLRRHARAARGLDDRGHRRAPAVGRTSSAASRGASMPSSRAASRTRCARCSRAACRRAHGRSPGYVYRHVLEVVRGERDARRRANSS